MCAGCTKKTLEIAEAMKKAQEAKAVAPQDYPPPRLAINCVCGLKRLIPTGLKLDDIFDLVPCPKCGMAFKGQFKGDEVQEVNG